VIAGGGAKQTFAPPNGIPRGLGLAGQNLAEGSLLVTVEGH